jgi:hypothetical protein
MKHAIKLKQGIAINQNLDFFGNYWRIESKFECAFVVKISDQIRITKGG